MTPACAACTVLILQLARHHHEHYAPSHTPVWQIVLAVVGVLAFIAVAGAAFDKLNGQ
jgi:hypothetical protein